MNAKYKIKLVLGSALTGLVVWAYCTQSDWLDTWGLLAVSFLVSELISGTKLEDAIVDRQKKSTTASSGSTPKKKVYDKSISHKKAV